MKLAAARACFRYATILPQIRRLTAQQGGLPSTSHTIVQLDVLIASYTSSSLLYSSIFTQDPGWALTVNWCA